MIRLILLSLLLAFLIVPGCTPGGKKRTIGQSRESLTLADKPLYRDPVHDAPTDPVLIWNSLENKWFMFYTARRANVEGLQGVTWVHGSRIGIAESSDGGATWEYRDTADIDYRMHEGYTYWAPEVIENRGTYHMYLSYVPGTFENWQHPRDIVHLTSKNLLEWKHESTLNLASGRVIDACVFQLPDGIWRMWYKNEDDGSSIYYADSKDLYNWEDRGKAFDGPSGEGPVVFRWKGYYWMLYDIWDGFGVCRSEDLTNWEVMPGNLLKEAGTGQDDKAVGHHGDVVVSGDRAFLFYFTSAENRRRSAVIQVTELQFKDGRISCNRDQAVYLNLKPQ
jgi:hypothetical protein